MTRSRRLPHLLGGVLAVTLAASVAPATGQVQAEIGELETRRNEIGLELADLDAQLAANEVELEGLDRAVVTAGVQIELLADDFERAVDARREPAATRVAIALAGFTAGDPRDNAVLEEIRVLSGLDDQDPTRARELYSAVIEDAQDRLRAADDRVRAVADRLALAQDDRATVIAAQDDSEARRQELGARRAELAIELEETISRLEYLRSLEDTALLTGLQTFEDLRRPVVAVKIDNVGPARPQSGLAAADLVYVIEVEGGLSRFAAVYHSTIPTEVGPVRSMRTSDYDLLAQFNAPLYATSGGNRIARQLLAESSLVDIGAARNGDLYYRTSRPAPHNLYTNAANLLSVGSGEDFSPGLPVPLFRFRGADDAFHPDAVPMAGVTIDYGRTVVEYDWNGSGWARSQDGSPTVDANGTRIAPATLIVQVTPYTASLADAKSPEAITVGQGDAWIFSDGRVVRGAWRRDEATAPIEYVDASTGNPLSILPGRTWIELPREGDTTLR